MSKFTYLSTALLACFGVLSTSSAFAQRQAEAGAVHAPTDVKPGSITYEEVPYPYPVQLLPMTVYGQDVRMAYMDIPPSGPSNGRAAVLFHGMNFGGFYFSGPMELLRKQGLLLL